MTDLLDSFSVTLPMAFFALGLIVLLIDIFLLGENYLIGIGVGAILTAVCVKLFGINSIQLAILIASINSLIAILVVKKTLTVTSSKKDINDY
jgi:membrane protein implicated in regulation of membrane protease activity